MRLIFGRYRGGRQRTGERLTSYVRNTQLPGPQGNWRLFLRIGVPSIHLGRSRHPGRAVYTRLSSLAGRSRSSGQAMDKCASDALVSQIFNRDLVSVCEDLSLVGRAVANLLLRRRCALERTLKQRTYRLALDGTRVPVWIAAGKVGGEIERCLVHTDCGERNGCTMIAREFIDALCRIVMI